MDKDAKIVIGSLAALVLTVGMVAGIYSKAGDGKDAPADAAIDAPPGVRTTNLDSPLVPPGKIVVTGVNLPEGTMYVPGTLTLTGDAVGRFEVRDVKQSESIEALPSGSGRREVTRRRLDVMAENTSIGEVRFTAEISYDGAPP